MTQAPGAASSSEADELRAAMTDRLIADGWIGGPEVEAAFRAVPRHLFVPDGTPLDTSYDVGQSVITKVGEDGASMSTVSAPWLQARMIAQAGIAPGMRVMEVGSGGYNAALIAEITGEKGLVVTVDIDPDVTARATAGLDAAGYGGRVVVVTADAEHGVPEHGDYDAVVVTVGAWDIAPAWLEQLAPDGVIVVPLRMNTFTRSLAFRRAGEHWTSTSAQLCGFVPMQGLGARMERRLPLRDPAGGHVTLLFDETELDDPSLLEGALESGPVKAWSGLTIPDQVDFADLHLWLAGFLPGFCRVEAGSGTPMAAEGVCRTWFPFGGVIGDSFCVMELRATDTPGGEYEFGARGYGPHAVEAAEALVAQIKDWDAHGREIPGDGFAYWPAGITIPLPGEAPVCVYRKGHGTATVTWPPAG
ncbi:methyltransferase, FxLD system [Pseudofrankia sp. BMG5.36]|uniref:methyltransferase, FxLD system n=1 Tax=Pseudofrankia sp. BMG5.36 TaxID=1834512 RepID=UPI0008D972E6|nr:methyltransferase, FxLD system [Pseudofrankia sp. BMG5.36]OHV64177.1 methyltransferase, FxLD system [Pseudofrankia sp. BMG5.36]